MIYRVGWAAVCTMMLVGACSSSRERPTCSAASDDCGMGWRCVERDELAVCRGVVIPYPCLEGTHVCLAEGILEEDEECIGDSECMEGLYCPHITDDGSERRCTVAECATDDECAAGQGCRNHVCSETLGGVCGPDFDCADHQYCRAGTCETAPAEGGNPCSENGDCAEGRICGTTPIGESLCSTCATDADCSASPSAPFCYASFCAACSETSCGAQVCSPTRGCVECIDDAGCADGFTCSNDICLQRCDFPNHEECDSGHCAFGDVCFRPVGSTCTTEAAGSSACGGGACVARDAAGTSSTAYCTRPCGSFDPPCPSGYTCVEDVDVDGVTSDLCLSN